MTNPPLTPSTDPPKKPVSWLRVAGLAAAVVAIVWIIYGFATAGDEGRQAADKSIASIERDIRNPPPAPAVRQPTTTVAAAATVESVWLRLVPAGAEGIVVNTAEDDPNRLLGRPGGYTARGTFALPGTTNTDPQSTDRGGSIEIWPTAEAASKRADYIRGLLDAGGSALGTEYHYLAGPVLVRVTGKVPPSTARPIEIAVAGLPK